MVDATLSLDGTWLVTWTDGSHGKWWTKGKPGFDPGRHLRVQVPGELHRELERLGLVEDPHVGLNSLRARWVEEQWWTYWHEFEVPKTLAAGPAQLVFERLDLGATVNLNGVDVGHHSNAHLPCRLDVTGKLRAGKNQLRIDLDSGLYESAPKEGSAYNEGVHTHLTKWHWLRKPAHQFGWDWTPRLVNVGITGSVRLELGNQPRFEQITADVELAPDHSRATIRLRARLTTKAARQYRVAARVHGEKAASQSALPKGSMECEVVLELPKPELWWPRGQGSQRLYTVEVTLSEGTRKVIGTTIEIGIRSIRAIQPAHRERGSHFILEVNGRPVFCKGANWVPPDLIYSHQPLDRTEKLLDLALQSNMNLLRIWGGATYVGHEVLDRCDRLGLLVWHDMPFACSRYPGDDPAFMANTSRELTWAVREYSRHASLAVWCGNNEIETSYPGSRRGRLMSDHSLYHHVIPKIIAREAPHTFYWPSSPFSELPQDADDEFSGDQHPWDVSLGAAGADFWAYRERQDRFPNEGGFLGASTPATLREALGSKLEFRSFAWEHHDNDVDFWQGSPGVCYQAIELWLGRKPEQMTSLDHLFASGLLQAEALREYITNYRRRMFDSAAAIYWMFNDSWPTTHGWPTFDSKLRKKLSFYPVAHAFAPVSVVVAEDAGTIRVYGVNDGQKSFVGELESGVFHVSRGVLSSDTIRVELPPNASVPLAEVSRRELRKAGERSAGAFARLLKDGRQAAQHRLLFARFGELELVREPKITARVRGGLAAFESDTFVWSACLDTDGAADYGDNCFDLIPGRPYAMPWPEGAPRPRVVRTGNSLIQAPPTRGRTASRTLPHRR
jgi:beta-mannosidase